MAEDYSQLVARAYQLQAEEQARQAQEQQAAQQRAAEAELLTRNRSTGEFLQDAGVQLVQGAVGLGQAAYGLTNLATLGGLDRVTGFSENFRTTNDILQGAKSAPTQAQVQNARRIFDEQGVLAGVGEYATDFTLLQDLLIGNLPSLIPAAAASRGAAVAATEAATAAGLGQTATRELVNQAAQRATLRAVAGQTAGATNVEAINQIDQYGGDENLQQLGGLGASVLAGAAASLISQLTGAARLEAAAANLLPGGAGALPALSTRGVLSATAGGAAREGVEEYAQSGTEQLAQNIVTPGRGIWEGVGEQAGLGALAGGVLGGGMGATVALGSPRTSTDSPLGQRLRTMLGQQNQAAGQPLSPSPLFDPVVPSPLVTVETGPTDVEAINLGDAPLPGELPLAQALPTVEEITFDNAPAPNLPTPRVRELPVEEINAAPAPLRSLFDITGRQPQVAYPAPPLAQVEELPPAQRTGLLGVVDAQRSRGQLGGTDLFAGQLDPMGAFPVQAPTNVQPAAVDVPATQRALDFDAPPLTWKKSLAQELGLKPNSFRGKAWDQFTQAAEQAGVRPGDAGAVDFLRAVAPQIASDPATAPLFAAKLVEKYAAPVAEADPSAAVAPVAPAPVAPAGTLADALAMSEDAYIRAVNPTGKTTDAEDLITVSAGDLDLPVGTTVIEQFTDSQGQQVDVHQDQEGILYAVQNGQVLGQMEPGAEDTLINVVREAQGRGIGTGLATAFVRRNPFAQAGSFSPAGERTRRAAFRRLQAEQKQAEGQARVDAAAGQAFAPAVPSDAVTPGGVSDNAAPIGLAATIARQRNLDPSASEEQHIADAMMDLLADATNVELLDETFIALKNSPEWNQLSDDQQTEIAEEFDIRYSRVEGGSAGKFQRAAARVDKPIEVSLFTNLVTNANRTRATGAPEVVPMESPADFEVATGQAAPQDAAGVFTDGKIYLIRQNLGSAHDLAVTLAHERGHYGLAALMGDRMPAVLNRLWTNAATRERIKAKMKALAGNVEPSDGGMRRLAAEEVLADMLASGEKVNGDVISKARSAIENTFSRLLGYSSLKMTNAEVDAILRDSGAVMRGTSFSAIRRGEPKHLQGLTDLMGDPRSTADGDARFSRALADLDQVTAAADAEGPGTRRPLNEITKQAGQAGLNAVKNLGASVKEGGAFSTLLDATPLNQLVNLYGKQFTDGDAKPLNDFARLKRAKESDFNKQLTQPSDLSYRDGEKKIQTSPLELAKQWQDFQRRSPAKGEALNQMQQFSTLYRLWPDSPWADQSKINYAEHSFTEDERKAALDDLQRLWRAVGPEGQAIFRDSQAVYTALWNKRFTALRNELARATGLDPKSPQFNQVYGRTIDGAMQRLKTGPYSPLQRYGDYLVTVRDKDGRIAWFSGHDTKSEADTVAKQLAESDFKTTDDFRINTTARTEFDWRLDGVSQAVINNLEKVALDALPGDDQSAVREEVRRALVEAYLQSLPQQSFLQHANKRKGVDGFTADAFRGFNDYSIKAARSIASLNYDGQISSKLNELQTFVTEKARGQGQTDTTKMQRVLNAVKSQHAASLNFERSPTADALSQAGFLWYMTSPSQLFINSMQTPMVTLPRLAGTYGNSKALGAVRSAIGAFAKSKGDLLGERSILAANTPEHRVLQQLYERGVLDFTLAHDMTGLANGESSAMSGHWRRFMEVASSFMHRSEVFNRQVTALAAARLEMERRGLNANNISDADVNSLTDSAEEAVLTTQFDYSQSNKPKLLQGPWRKLIFQFQQYRLNMLAMMAKDIRDGFIAKDASAEERASARRALSWLLGMQLVLTGAAGTVLAPFVFAIADAFRDDEDLLDSRTEFVNAVPQWMAHGVLAGALDTSRLGADSLIPILGDRVYAPKDATAQETFSYYVMRNIGPWAGLVGGAFSGVDKAFNGDTVGAAKGLMPAPVRDFYKALYESQAGAKDARQVVYFEPGVWDTVTGAVGLRSGERRQVEGIRGASFEAANRANTLRQRYLTQLAIGHATGDQELVDGAMQKIQAWNSANPEQGIRPTDVRRAVVNRYRAQVNADLYGVPSARPPSEALKAQLGL